MTRPSLKAVAVALLGATLVGIQLYRAPELSMATFAIVATCWWFARLQLSRNIDRHPHRAKRARQIRKAVINSGVLSAAIWLVIALIKASKDMGAEQSDPLVAPAPPTEWPGLFMVDGLLMVLGLSYLMLSACMIFFAQPRPKRRKRVRRRPDANTQPLEAESGS